MTVDPDPDILFSVVSFKLFFKKLASIRYLMMLKHSSKPLFTDTLTQMIVLFTKDTSKPDLFEA